MRHLMSSHVHLPNRQSTKFKGPTCPRYFQTGITFKYLCKLGSHRWHASHTEYGQNTVAVSKGAAPVAGAISNIPFMAAYSHDGMASGMYHKPEIPNRVTYRDSTLLSCLQKISKKLQNIDNDLYELTMYRKMKDPVKNVNHLVG